VNDAAALELRGVSKRFGGVQALAEVALLGFPGEVHGIVGPNGAGKSTLLGCISGLVPIDAGEILFESRRIEGVPTHGRARMGIARTFQKIRLAEQLTVFENVAIGAAALAFGSRRGYRRLLAPLSSAAIAVAVDEALESAGMVALRNETVASLPYGKRHFVELARCLVARPRLLLLDEPATGLTEAERQRLGRIVGDLTSHGCLVLLVEHDLKLVGELCARVTVLDSGRPVFTGTPGEAQRSSAVIEAYLGSAKFGHDA
jgi:branched-chain amino acid transport system ATP-binding protein